jgi:hypothetical protein
VFGKYIPKQTAMLRTFVALRGIELLASSMAYLRSNFKLVKHGDNSAVLDTTAQYTNTVIH